MVAGVVVLAIPVLVGGPSLGWIANKLNDRSGKTVEKLEHTIQELKTIGHALNHPATSATR